MRNEQTAYRTLIGSILSCLTFGLVGLLAIYKLIALVNFENYRYQLNKNYNHYEANEEFGHKENFAVAFGVSDYFSVEERLLPIEDPSIGEVKLYIKWWGDKRPAGAV